MMCGIVVTCLSGTPIFFSFFKNKCYIWYQRHCFIIFIIWYCFIIFARKHTHTHQGNPLSQWGCCCHSNHKLLFLCLHDTGVVLKIQTHLLLSCTMLNIQKSTWQQQLTLFRLGFFLFVILLVFTQGGKLLFNPPLMAGLISSLTQ